MRDRIKAPIAVFLAATLLVLASPRFAISGDTGRKLYQEHCSECHHVKRLGLTAPPLIPGLFSRSVKGKLDAVIRDGLPATQMPSFMYDMNKEQIDLVVDYIKSPVDEKELAWTDKDIIDSREKLGGDIEKSGAGPVITDLENVTLVMERGTKSLVILQSAELNETAKFFVGAVHGGPKFSYSLEDVYAVARDGRVTKFNLPTLKTEYILKAGINSRSIAVSHDDKVVAVANYLPRNIVFFNDKLEPQKTIDLPGKAGGFYSMPALKSFVVSFRDTPELWLIYPGEDYKIEKIKLPAPFEDFSISPAGNYILGTKRGSEKLFIYDYIKREVAATLPTSGLPHLASASFWKHKGKLYAGINHIKKPVATIISMEEKKAVAEIPLPGAGFFVRTHYDTPYLWIDTMTEKVALVDKNDFTSVKFITPRAGAKSMHVEFTRDGQFALITVPGPKGEVTVYDASTLKKVKSMPYNRPVGKYNAVNKTYPERSLERKTGAATGHDGKAVFDDYCMGCHHQVYEAFGPPFAEIALIRSETEIRDHIASPGKSSEELGYDRNSMSYIKLSKKQTDAIVSYIMSFRED